MQHLTYTASEVLGKARQKKKLQMTNDILDLCDRRRSLKKRRKEHPMQCRTTVKSIKYSEESLTDVKKLIVQSEQETARWFLTF